MRYSVQPINNVFDTGDKPVLVLCDDTTFYVCKHNGHSNTAKRLFCELLSNELLDALKT